MKQLDVLAKFLREHPGITLGGVVELFVETEARAKRAEEALKQLRSEDLTEEGAKKLAELIRRPGRRIPKLAALLSRGKRPRGR